MSRIGVVGANGQVGAEVCLLLRQIEGLEVVPIVRNPQGSAFLRWHGFRCRHGEIGDPALASGLIGDCDVVLNFALATGRPKAAREANTAVIQNLARLSPAGAKIVYFSTQNVYGDATPERWIRWKGLYGREKLRGEALSLVTARAQGKPCWVFRLGHVCGELQGISSLLRTLVRAGPVVLAENGEVLSNCTHCVSIADVVRQIATGEAEPGTYDLVNCPQWTWREIYAWEAARADVPLSVRSVPARQRRGPRQVLQTLAEMLTAGFRTGPMRELGMQILSRFPDRIGARMQAAHYRRRAVAEVAELHRSERSHDACDWLPVPGHFMPGQSDAHTLLAKYDTPVATTAETRLAPVEPYDTSRRASPA